MKHLFAILSAMTLASGVALAGGNYGKEDMQAGFGKADLDGDGVLSMEEAKTIEGLDKVYKDVDANADGGIDKAEFSAFESWSQPSEEAAQD